MQFFTRTIQDLKGCLLFNKKASRVSYGMTYCAIDHVIIHKIKKYCNNSMGESYTTFLRLCTIFFRTLKRKITTQIKTSNQLKSFSRNTTGFL